MIGQALTAETISRLVRQHLPHSSHKNTQLAARPQYLNCVPSTLFEAKKLSELWGGFCTYRGCVRVGVLDARQNQRGEKTIAFEHSCKSCNSRSLKIASNPIQSGQIETPLWRETRFVFARASVIICAWANSEFDGLRSCGMVPADRPIGMPLGSSDDAFCLGYSGERHVPYSALDTSPVLHRLSVFEHARV